MRTLATLSLTVLLVLTATVSVAAEAEQVDSQTYCEHQYGANKTKQVKQCVRVLEDLQWEDQYLPNAVVGNLMHAQCSVTVSPMVGTLDGIGFRTTADVDCNPEPTCVHGESPEGYCLNEEGLTIEGPSWESDCKGLLETLAALGRDEFVESRLAARECLS